MKRSWFLNMALYSVLCAAPALADGPQPFPEFTFKRIGVPQGGSTGRITVQIDPAEQAAALAVPDAGGDAATAGTPDAQATPGAPALSGYEWFWQTVSADVAGAGPANTGRALSALRDRAGNPTPRLQDLQNIAQAHGVDILRATVGTNISPALVLAVISVESGGKVNAESQAGAQGLMQLIPATAERFGVTDSSVAADNIGGGVAYLEWLMEKFDQDPILTLAGYNAGEGAVVSHEGVPPFAETRAYIPRVLSAWQVARGLCLTPPELLTDGCVFAVKGAPGNG